MTPNPRLLHTLFLVSTSAALSVALTACGGDDSGDDSSGGGAAAGESCASSADCASNLLCIGAVCVDGSSSSNGADAGTDSGDTTGGGTDTGVAMDTGGGNEDTGGGGMDTGGAMDTGGGGTELTGGVSIFEAKVSAGILFTLNRGNVGAAFVEPGSDPPPIQTVGACDVINVSADSTGGPFGYDAGSISVMGTSRPVTLTPNAGGSGSVTYTSNLSEDNQDIYNPNASITISAAGGADIPAFNGTITSPGEHEMTSPAPDASVSGDTNIAWSPAQSGNDVLVSVVPLNAVFSPIDGPGLSCAVPSDSGSFTIPAAAMDALQGPRLAITVIKVVNQSVQAGSNTVVLNVTYAHGSVVTLN